MAAAAAVATLTVRSRSQCLLAGSAPLPAHVVYRRAAAATPARRTPPRGSRLRALPPELSEILSPKLVPGSPSDTGDVSSLIPVSALMLLFYFVSNWVVPELVLKRLQRKAAAEEDASTAAAMFASSPSGQQGQGGGDNDDARKAQEKSKSKEEIVIKWRIQIDYSWLILAAAVCFVCIQWRSWLNSSMGSWDHF